MNLFVETLVLTTSGHFCQVVVALSAEILFFSRRLLLSISIMLCIVPKLHILP